MDDNEPRVIPFTARTGRGGKEPPDGSDPADAAELVADGDAYAVARGTRTPAALRFLLRNGKTFALPYAYHPVIWGESPGLVLLEYPKFFTVILAGRNLGLLEARLCDQRVTWIRECGEAQAALLPVAVTHIERLNRYPSRETDGNGSGQ